LQDMIPFSVLMCSARISAVSITSQYNKFASTLPPFVTDQGYRRRKWSPGPLVAFPGAYKSTDPGILVDLGKYTTNSEGYQPPGPAVWRA
jgi:hypothetical protein